MVFMNFWDIQHYTYVGDDFAAKMNNIKHIKWFT